MLRCTFVTALVAFVLWGTPTSAQNRFQTSIDAWVAQDSLNPPPDDAILFVGDSHLRFWETLTRDFAEYDVIQRGFGGAFFSDLNSSVSDIVLPYNPLAIVTDLGGNDVHFGGKSAQRVFDDYVALVDLVHTGQDQSRPPIPILHLGSIPTRDQWTKWTIDADLNSMIEAHSRTDDSLYYIDTPTSFLATSPAPGQPPSADLFVQDGLHLSSKGYAIWKDAVATAFETQGFLPKTAAANPLHPQPGSRILIDLGPSNQEDGRHTVSPDESGNDWNNWHPVMGSRFSGSYTPILAGESLGNLLTIQGQETGIDLIVIGDFGATGRRDGGLLGPKLELLGDFAVATATEDFFVAGASDNSAWGGIRTGGFMVTGLDPSLSYDFRFFGTRRLGSRSPHSTIYRVAGAGDFVEASLQTSGRNIGSDGQYDGNDSETVTVNGVRSDEFGQIFVDVHGEGTHFTYLGIMEISVISVFGDCNVDGLLNAADLSCASSIEARDSILDALDTLPGDLDGDGEVAFADFLLLSTNFGKDLPSYTDGNIDLNEGVAFADFLILSANFGKTPSDVAAVPEPHGFALIWLSVLTLVAFRRSRWR